MSQLEQFFAQVTATVLGEENITRFLHQNVVKQNVEKLLKHGDISFPTQMQAWSSIVAQPQDGTAKKIVNRGDDEFVRKLIESSQNWIFVIKQVKIHDFCCDLYLDRPKCYANLLNIVLHEQPQYGKWYQPIGAQKMYTVGSLTKDDSLSAHRCLVFAKVLNNLLAASGYKVLQPSDNYPAATNISITYAKRDTHADETQIDGEHNNNNNAEFRIVCGAVRSRSDQTADDYIKIRSHAMEKMAELKYENRQEPFDGFDFRKLGAAIVTFDLLKVKYPTAIDFDSLVEKQSTVKGSAFILYNVARIQTLLEKFDTQVKNGFYDELPEINQIDFSLLKEEEEWAMFFVYVVGFPSVLERCVGAIDNGQIAIHVFCSFLHNLSSLFSAYYHRVKILTDNLPQLVPVMYARIYLLRAISAIFHKSLSILEIEPLNKM